MIWASWFAKFNYFLLVFTTCLVASLGLAFLAMSIVGCTNIIRGATLFPAPIFPLCGVLGGLTLLVAILNFISIRYPRKPIILLALVLILVVLIIQITLGVLVQQREENPFGYMSQQWHNRGDNYRNHLQDEFQCCGYANVFDDTVISDICPPASFLSKDPCFYALTNYIDNHFYKAHSFLFSTLSVDFMALLNGLTMLCLSRQQLGQKRDSPVIPLGDETSAEFETSCPPKVVPFPQAKTNHPSPSLVPPLDASRVEHSQL